MDIERILLELREEKVKIDEAILVLERLSHAAPDRLPAARSGRKNMNPTERKAVSERMRRYWADRRGKPAAKSATS